MPQIRNPRQRKSSAMPSRRFDADFIDGIRRLIADARTTVARGVNLLQVRTNFEIGRRIVDEEQRGQDRAAYGEELVRTLADRLTAEFGRGFSLSNLKSMRLFYLQNQPRIGQTASGQFKAATNPLPAGESAPLAIGQSLTGEFLVSAIGQTASGQFDLPPRPFTLSWSHYVFLLRIKNPNERSFYEIESAAQNWTVRELRRQFDSGLYERLALSRDMNGIRRLARNGYTVEHPHDLLKEPLVLEFLGLDEQTRYSESDLESAIITRIETSCSNSAKASSSKRARSASRSTRSTSSSTWFSTTACCAATSSSI